MIYGYVNIRTKPNRDKLLQIYTLSTLLIRKYILYICPKQYTKMKNTHKTTTSAMFADSKPHYELLDGLRGVAALLVIWYHVWEGFAFVGGGLIETINHGYLAVDFFFMLSGFVISYAYDDRWGKMGMKEFFTRRLIRLHPMLIFATVIGVTTFLIQGSTKWDGTQTPFGWVMLAMLLTMFFIPALPGARYEVRGNGEMFPLNGPSWSLFFEYIGNILYALFIRRLSTKALKCLTALLGVAFAYFAIMDVSGYGMIGVGWTIDKVNFIGGMLRMLFPFTLGMVLARGFSPVKIKGALWICSAILFALFSVPYLEGQYLNGLYEMFCIMIVFPALVWLGASGKTTDVASTKICKFLGDISYPVYIIHYPFMYLFYYWIMQKPQCPTIKEVWPVVVVLIVGVIVLAYAILKLYDEPVRKWLAKKFIKK